MKNFFHINKGSYNYGDLLALCFVTAVCLWQYDRLDPVNIALLYIFPILLTAIRRGNLQVFFISILSIILFNFLFVPPRFSLTVAQPHFLFTFTILVIVGQVVAYLANEAKKAKELETSEITKDAILSSLSHELRTPLSAVMGASSSLLDPSIHLEESEKIELVESIHDGSIRIHSLMENLLNMARLENGKLKPNKTDTDPVELIGTAIGKFDYEIAKNISISEQKCKNIECDASLVELALLNILENSVKYGSDIEVCVREEGLFAVFEVSNSTTLDETSDLEHIFDKFGRLSNAASHSGVGLGLAICKAIAEIHNGKITAKIRNNRFIVKLYIAMV